MTITGSVPPTAVPVGPRVAALPAAGTDDDDPPGSASAGAGRGDRAGVPRPVIRHRVQTSAATFGFCFVAKLGMSRRRIGEVLADAVAELRAIDTTFSPRRGGSLVSRFRRGEIAAETYPPLRDLVERCAAMRTATHGWFDAWAVPGGFHPGGLLKGWAVERAAARLRAAGITDYAVTGGHDLTVRGHAPHGGPWRVAVRHPHDRRRLVEVLELTTGSVATTGTAGRRDHIVDPRTGEPADRFAVATVVGPDLTLADGYATALAACGAPALDWFPTADGYRALVVDTTGRPRTR